MFSSNSCNKHMCVQIKGIWSGGAKWKDLERCTIDLKASSVYTVQKCTLPGVLHCTALQFWIAVHCNVQFSTELHPRVNCSNALWVEFCTVLHFSSELQCTAVSSSPMNFTQEFSSALYTVKENIAMALHSSFYCFCFCNGMMCNTEFSSVFYSSQQ